MAGGGDDLDMRQAGGAEGGGGELGGAFDVGLVLRQRADAGDAKKVQQLADKNFALLQADPKHPSLHFKKIAGMWSARVGAHYRARGFDHEGGVLWFWIDSHSEYDKMIP